MNEQLLVEEVLLLIIVTFAAPFIVAIKLKASLVEDFDSIVTWQSSTEKLRAIPSLRTPTAVIDPLPVMMTPGLLVNIPLREPLA